MARLGARCLSAVSAYDNTLETVETLDSAQVKFDDILNSPSVDAACEKIRSLAKAKELDSSLILLINSAWASAKESTTMKNEVFFSLLFFFFFQAFIRYLTLTFASFCQPVNGSENAQAKCKTHTLYFCLLGSEELSVL